MVTQIFIVALFTYGYCTTFTKGHIFEKVGDWAEKNLPEKLWKPIGGCAICTAFWAGTLMYWLFWGDIWYHWLMISIAAVGVNAFLSNLLGKLEDLANAIDPPQD